MTAGTRIDCRPAGWSYSLILPSFDPRNFSSSGKALRHFCGYEYPQGLKPSYFAGNPMSAPIYIDVGANYGMSLLPFLSRGWTVLAFEPSRQNADVIRAAVDLNPDIPGRLHLIEAAASNTNSDSTPFFTPLSGRLDNAALSEHAARLNIGGKVNRVWVRSVRPDDALKAMDLHMSNVRYIKCDTQGHEVNALQGMSEIVRWAHPDLRLQVEYSEPLQLAQGHTPTELLRLMSSMGLAARCRGRCIVTAEELITASGDRSCMKNVQLQRASQSCTPSLKSMDSGKRPLRNVMN